MSIESDFLRRDELGRPGGSYAIAYALMQVAAAIERLGHANAVTPMMDAMTNALIEIGDGLGAIASAINSVEAKMKGESE